MRYERSKLRATEKIAGGMPMVGKRLVRAYEHEHVEG